MKSSPSFLQSCRFLHLALIALLASCMPLRIQADVSTSPAAPSFTNATVHDPAVVRDGSNYYVFGSHMASASSGDLLNWTQLTTSAAYPNSLIRNQNPQTEFSEALTWAQTTTFWAPDVVKLGDGKYYYYYCACQGSSPLSALGLAVADSITGPYANVGIMLKSGMAGLSPAGVVYNVNIHPNVVDPSVFFDKTGKLWMVYGSFSGGIFILPLDSTVGSPTLGQPLPNQGYGKKLIGGNSSRIEGPTIVYSPESNYYYLLMTFGGLDAVGGYNIRMGRSLNPDGPFLDPLGNDLTNVKGNFAFDDATIAPFGAKLMGNWQFLHVAGEPTATSRGYVSPGGCSVYRDPALGRYSLVFHTRFVGRGEQHEIRVHQMYINEDGWLVVSPQRFAQEAVSTTDATLIPGDYKLINHGKAISATVNTSTAITLNANGSVTGSATGTWRLSGDHFATLTLGVSTYKGVFVQVWDDDNQVWVNSFTALSADGTAIWGCKVAATTTNVAPSITAQPSGLSITAGSAASFSVTATGTPAPSYQWRRNGVNIAGAVARTYTIPSAAVTDAAAYSVVVANSVTSFLSAPATLSVTAAQGPVISTQPVSQIVSLGGSVTFSPVVTGPGTLSFQWHFNGTPIGGATNSSYTISSATPAQAGAYTVAVTSGSTTVTSSAAMLALSYATPTSNSRLYALSCRAVVGTGSDVLIPAFAISGSGSRQVIIRASGPALVSQGVSASLILNKPQMKLYNAFTHELIASNTGWSSGAAANTSALQAAFTQAILPPFAVGSADSALLATFDAGTAYSVVVSGADGGTGVSLIEVYELGSGSAKMNAISCRAKVGAGDNVLIPGIIITGTDPKQVLIRASGPALTSQGVDGVLSKPRLELYSAGVKLAENIGWSTAANAAEVSTVSPRCGLTNFPAGSADCTLLVTLQPGGYAAVVSGVGDTTGVSLIEVYEVP